MGVEALVCDASGTLLDNHLQPQPGVVDMLTRLATIGVQIVVAANHSEDITRTQLGTAGLLGFVDHIVAHEHVGIDKGSPAWVKRFYELTHLQPNQFFYVGNSLFDMITATRGPMIYAHSAWSGSPAYAYGLVAPKPAWVAGVIEHIFRKLHSWYWTIQGSDNLGRQYQAVTLLDANGAGDYYLRTVLLNLLKSDIDSKVGPMTLKEFVMLHMLASLNYDGDFAAAQFWTTYPGHFGTPNNVMGNFLDVAAKLARNKYREGLLKRHAPAVKSNEVYKSHGLVAAVQNQFTTMQVGPEFKSKLKDRRVLLLDNFLTWGSTTESGRNLLLAAGAASVKVACVGKYGSQMYVVSVPQKNIAPFDTGTAQVQGVQAILRSGNSNNAALTEFAQSYAAMAKESW